MSGHDDKNGLIYLLAGFGLGALIGAAAGLLFAPKPGEEIRGELADKLKDAKGKTEDWIAEQRDKRGGKALESDEVGV
jgi:gas vesicle protein